MTFEIGDPYQTARKTYEPITQYSFRAGRHELGLILSNPTPEHIQGLCDCKAEVAFYAEEDVIFFLYYFPGEIGWTEVPFNYHLLPSAERSLPDDPTGLPKVFRDRLDMVFVNKQTNVVEGIRSNRFGHGFTVAFREALITQAKQPWVGQAMWNRRIRQIYAHHQNTNSMLIDCDYQCVLQGLETRW